MNQYAMFALVVIIGLAIFPLGFEITQRLSVRYSRIPAPPFNFMGGRKFLRWRDFNVHKYGDTLGMVPMIGFVVLACREAHWVPLFSTYAAAIYLLAALGACLWAMSVLRAIRSGKINRYDWGFAGLFEAKITIAGYYHTFVTALRFATIGLAAILMISGSASDTLTLCMILSFAVWILTAIIDMQSITLETSVLFLWALLVALVEICIEREVGWALLAPTWHQHNVVYAALMSGKDLTGYHLFMFVLPFVLLHLPFAFGRYWGGLKWTLAREVEILAIYFVTCVCWDFLWFVLNPSFTLERFRPGEIWWHEQWVGRVPNDYIGGIGLAIGLTAIVRWRWDKGVVKRMGMIFTTFAFFVAMTVFVAPVYHRWDKEMREAHGGLTERWNNLSLAKRERLMEILEQSDRDHAEAGRIGRDLAQCQQLGIGCRNRSSETQTSPAGAGTN